MHIGVDHSGSQPSHGEGRLAARLASDGRAVNIFWTSMLLLGAATLAAYCLWHQRRPRELGEVSLFPSTMLLGIATILIVTALAHLVTLTTGVPMPGRM